MPRQCSQQHTFEDRIAERFFASVFMVERPKFLLGFIDLGFAGSGEVFPRTVLVKGKHRHRRSERRGFSPGASVCRTLERQGKGAWGFPEHTILKRHRIARLGDLLRPAFACRLLGRLLPGFFLP